MGLLGTAVGADFRCLARGQPTACGTFARAPSCGRAAAANLRALAVGNTSADSAARDVSVERCRSAIATAIGLFAERRFHERRLGSRATRGGRITALIARACDGVDRAALPVGGACSAAVDVAVGAIDGPTLARCMRASVTRIVDDVAPTPLRPNIVLILTDDQRADTLGYMPATFERLAGRGLVFQNAFATTPACSPSRASIYSGKISRRHGVIANGVEAAFDPSSTIGTALADVGYATGFFGKYLNAVELLGLDVPPGWDEWNVFLRPSGGSYFGSRLNENGVVRVLAEDDYSTDVLADRAVNFIQANADRPFFVVYSPYAPHDPSSPAPRHENLFAGLPPHRPPNWREADISLKPTWVRFYAHISTPDGAIRRERQRLRELETLLAVDDAVRKITDTLERQGLTDDTLVVFVSDHGIHWGEHWTGTKFSSYEESIRIPFVMRYPARIPLPRASEAFAATIDIAPTLADVAGARLPTAVDGRSLFDLVDPPAGGPAWREEIAIESAGGLITAPSRALRTPRWKYIELPVDNGPDRELYDLDADPYELRNLAEDPAYGETRALLAQRLQAALPRATGD